MQNHNRPIVRRSDYRPPGWRVEHIELDFELDPAATGVVSRMRLRRNPQGSGPAVFHGEDLELVDIRLDSEPVPAHRFRLSSNVLEFDSLPDCCEMQITTRIVPGENTTLNGLYVSNGNFFTQCEAEGFRRITYFPDRPDIMATYRVRISAPRDTCPTLLSNGNLIAQGADSARPGWHWAQWEDPFPKPSYLFALVAGRFEVLERRIATRSGREVLLQIHVEPGNLDKSAHAMDSLVHSIRWDERRFGLELDLERFMIVAVSDFNMGAMENKGLNIFNTRYVFASPGTATDADFAHVESVVGHEYFHNWTGNRVTCRDWFQLTLKEGLTVYRDQEFSADRLAEQSASAPEAASARAVKRIEDVRVLRLAQFAEDAGPMAHPIRPESYQEINNFYTLTVYEKGAEVIRMLATMVGETGFRRGMDRYFACFDGQAVTCDDFVDAIAQANGRDFAQFRRWYSQSGTPRIHVESRFDATRRRLQIAFRQQIPAQADGRAGEPMHLPVAIGLIGRDGAALAVPAPREGATDSAPSATRILELTEAAQTFTFDGFDAAPVPSLLRGFSAPVVVEYAYDTHELLLLASHDPDPFNRWDALQRLAMRAILGVLDGARDEAAIATVSEPLYLAFEQLLADESLDDAFRHLALSLPAEGFVIEQLEQVDPLAVRMGISQIRRQLGIRLSARWQALATRALPPYSPEPAHAGRRALRATALAYWVDSGEPLAEHCAWERFSKADNMTDRASAMSTLLASKSPRRAQALAQFENLFAGEPLVMDKWFSMQAVRFRQTGEPPVLDSVRKLLDHPAFSIKNPNKVRALIGAFCTGNPAEFHAIDGSGYRFWVEQVRRLDAINPQIAARLARAMDRWKKFEPTRQSLMIDALRELRESPALSGDVIEIIGKSLADS